MESNIIIANQLQHRAAKVVGQQLGFGIETAHELSQVGTVLLQFPFTVHFYQGQKVHACGTQRMLGGRASRVEAAP